MSPSMSRETSAAVQARGAAITIANHVHLELYFDGNFWTKADNIINNSSYAGNLQIYAISPMDPSVQQVINLNSGGLNRGIRRGFFTRSADFTINEGPDLVGRLFARTSTPMATSTGITIVSLIRRGDAIDYRVISYVEDTR
jgi:hypothetical protein